MKSAPINRLMGAFCLQSKKELSHLLYQHNKHIKDNHGGSYEWRESINQLNNAFKNLHKLEKALLQNPDMARTIGHESGIGISDMLTLSFLNEAKIATMNVSSYYQKKLDEVLRSIDIEL